MALRKTTEDAILIETLGSRINDDHYYRGAAPSTYGHHTMIFSDEFLRMKRDNNKKSMAMSHSFILENLLYLCGYLMS